MAREYVQNTSKNIFLTGRAGTGKTTFLRNIVTQIPKNTVVVAPTGVAAINAGGLTIHSFFQLPFGMYSPSRSDLTKTSERNSFKLRKRKIDIIRSLELLIIDEVSMVRADLLDAIDNVLRRYRHNQKPFGGVQLLMIGDIQQLSPVVSDEEWDIMKEEYRTPYFFDSIALKNTAYVCIELKHIYRQRDKHFVDLLEKIRTNDLNTQDFGLLNSRYIPDFEPKQEEGYIILCTHNRKANSINEKRLEMNENPTFEYECSVQGNFPEFMYPQDAVLQLKEGAQVMFTKNDSSPEKRYVNGTLGIVSYLDEDKITVDLLDTNKTIDVDIATWENIRYDIDEKTKEISPIIEGLFRHYPLRLAWAITVHKSQGLTFDKVVVDAGRSFAHGQVYVAMSRCRTFEGMVLSSKITQNSIISDASVLNFNQNSQQRTPNEESLETDKIAYYREVVTDLFSFEDISKTLKSLYYFSIDKLSTQYPKFCEEINLANSSFELEILDISKKFEKQLYFLVTKDFDTNTLLHERCSKGSVYFHEKLSTILSSVIDTLKGIEIDNTEDANKLKLICDKICGLYFVKKGLMEIYQSKHIVVSQLQKDKLLLLAEKDNANNENTDTDQEKPKKSKKIESSGDIENPELYAALKEWRSDKAAEMELRAYQIVTNKALLGVSNNKPTSIDELMEVKGIGKNICNKYGDEILDIICGYL